MSHTSTSTSTTTRTNYQTSSAAAAAAASTTAPTTAACPSPRDPSIRHAGRAHIRGKIRRVWRPRYLELCDTGLVRYYELPPTADVTLPEDSDWDHVHMIPKDTLVIYHARIIDVTTLRDLHVGLPRGSFGFLFRGRQRQQQLLMTHPEQPNPPREYFCAVSTLEEAQTWVIALQWAASVNEKHRRRPSAVMIPDCHLVPRRGSDRHEILALGDDDDEDDDNDNEDDEHAPALDKPPPPAAPLPPPAPVPPVAEQPSQRQDPSQKHTKPGRIVVTKVYGYRIVKLASHPFQWELAYEIALLLLQVPKVEERRILRTPQELERLLDQLLLLQTIELEDHEDEDDDDNDTNNTKKKKKSKDSTAAAAAAAAVLKEWRPKVQQLPRFPTATPTTIVESFAVVDGMLRALAMDAHIVNATAMKRWFVLDWDPPQIYKPVWWQTMPNHSITHRHVRRIRDNETDDFVKNWLTTTTTTRTSSPPTTTTTPSLKKPKTATTTTTEHPILLWILQRPWVLVGGAGVALALLVPILRIYQRLMISISIRLDILVASWCLAAYVGQEYRPSRSTSTTRPAPRPKRLKSTAASSSSSIVLVKEGGGGGGEAASEVAGTGSDEEESAADGDDLEEYDGQPVSKLSSPLPPYPHNNGESCWSMPPDNSIFRVRGNNYLEDRIKIPSARSPFVCRGVDIWLTDNPERHIARHPDVLGGQLGQEDTFLVNFLLPFGNFVSYFTIPPLEEFPGTLAEVWTKFLQGDQQYRDARLKLLPVVMDGPWIVKAAVGNGTAPALLGKVIPLQYFFKDPDHDKGTKGVYEVDVIITASSIAKGILSVVKGHTKSLTIAFAFIIEAAEKEELPETVLCAFQVHALHLEDCPHLPECNLDEL